MRIIRPSQITESELTASNAPINDATEWVQSTYSAGSIRMVTTTDNGASQATFKVYQSTRETSADPTLRTTYESNNDVFFDWRELSSVNRYKMFDQVIQDQTEVPEEIAVTVEPSEIVNSIAFVNLDAASVRVVIEADPEGVVYDETFNMIVDGDVDNWWDWYFTTPERDKNLAIFAIPGFTGAKIHVTITAPEGVAKCGAMVIGVFEILGKSQYQASFGIRTYSRKITDEDFRAQIEPRAFSDRQEIPIKIKTTRLGVIKRILTDVLNTATVYVVDEGNRATIIYGFYQDFDIIVPGPVVSDCLIEIEGLL